MIRSVRKQINRSLILMTICSASLVVAEDSETTDQQGHVPVNESELFENLLDESGLQEDSEGLMTEPLPGTIAPPGSPAGGQILSPARILNAARLSAAIARIYHNQEPLAKGKTSSSDN